MRGSGVWVKSDRGMEPGGGAFTVSRANPEESERYASQKVCHPGASKVSLGSWLCQNADTSLTEQFYVLQGRFGR